MKKIKLFLVATDEDLTEDRMAIADLIGTLNDKYEEKELYFQLVKPKTAPTEKELLGCEMAFILWFHHSDEITAASFEQALAAFQKSGKPKIITYFKQSDGLDVADDVSGFMERLDRELGHYYNLYEHIDSLRFSLLMQMSALESSISLACKNGDVLLEGEKYISLYDVPCAAQNKTLSELKTALKKATARFFELRELHADDEDNEVLTQQYIEAAEHRSTLRSQVADMERNIFAASISMARDLASGALSDRQREAYRLFDKGDFEGANAVLNFEEIKEDIKIAEVVASAATTRLQTSVNELLQKISVLMAGVLSQQTYGELESCYREAVRVEETHNLPKTAMEQYFQWKMLHHANEEAIALGEKLLLYCKLAGGEGIPFLQALADLYFLVQEYEKAEQYAQQVLALGKTNSQYALQNIGAHVLLSRVETLRIHYKTALSLCDKGQQLYDALPGIFSQESSIHVRNALCAQTIECTIHFDDYDKALARCKAECRYIENLLKPDDTTYLPLLLEWKMRLAKLFIEVLYTVQAQNVLISMQEQAENVLAQDPIRYAPILAEIYLVFSNLLTLNCFNRAGLQYAERATKTIQLVYDIAPKTHWALAVQCQLAQGKSLHRLGNKKHANTIFKNAIEVCEKHARQLELMDNQALLCELYGCMGELCFYTKATDEERMEYFDKANAIAAAMADEHGSVRNIRRYCHCNIQRAECYISVQVQYSTSKSLMDTTIAIFEEYLQQHLSKAYLDYVNAFQIRGQFYYKMGEWELALDDIQKSINIMQEYRPYNTTFFPCEFDLLVTAWQLAGCIYEELKDTDNQRIAFEKSYECCEQMSDFIHTFLSDIPDDFRVGGTLFWEFSDAFQQRKIATVACQLGQLYENLEQASTGSERLGYEENAEKYLTIAHMHAHNAVYGTHDRNKVIDHAVFYWVDYVRILRIYITFGMSHPFLPLHTFARHQAIVDDAITSLSYCLESDPNHSAAVYEARAILHDVEFDLWENENKDVQDAALLKKQWDAYVRAGISQSMWVPNESWLDNARFVISTLNTLRKAIGFIKCSFKYIGDEAYGNKHAEECTEKFINHVERFRHMIDRVTSTGMYDWEEATQKAHELRIVMATGLLEFAQSHIQQGDYKTALTLSRRAHAIIAVIQNESSNKIAFKQMREKARSLQAIAENTIVICKNEDAP